MLKSTLEMVPRVGVDWLKSPYWPNVVGGGALNAAALEATGEGLAPGVGRVDPSRGPVEVLHEPSNTLQVVIDQFHLAN